MNSTPRPPTPLETLETLRTSGGAVDTVGLPLEVVAKFLDSDPALARAVDEAWDAYEAVRADYPDLAGADEAVQVETLQKRLVNFYAADTVNPYVALAARGPWVVTSKGAVLHDSGGYGMLGLGHGPDRVLEVLGRPQVMANVMTPSFSQHRLIQALEREIGHRRAGDCPFTGFIFMNSGSEAVTVGTRISDINAKIQTDPGGAHEGKAVRRISLVGSFHGRTGRPAEFSHSALKTYVAHLATFRQRGDLKTVVPNDVEDLRAAFAAADEANEFIEAFFMEPVMGEGNPGLAITRAFYDAARELTKAHGSLLLVDSIQAGLRAQGCLSIIDYPGFEDCDPPDMETYSKALNAGQYPLSVLALRPDAAALYRTGVYGNTMTTAPRAMEVGSAVLEGLTDDLRANIREMGAALLAGFTALAEDLGGPITGVQGTGLLVSCALDPERYVAYGENSIEEYMRKHGIGVIHGGAASLRFTPHFALKQAEVDLLVERVRDAVLNGPTR